MSRQTPAQSARGRPGVSTRKPLSNAQCVCSSRAAITPQRCRTCFVRRSLSRSSLYAAFGDKRCFSALALDRYVADAPARMDIELHPIKSRSTACGPILPATLTARVAPMVGADACW